MDTMNKAAVPALSQNILTKSLGIRQPIVKVGCRGHRRLKCPQHRPEQAEPAPAIALFARAVHFRN